MTDMMYSVGGSKSRLEKVEPLLQLVTEPTYALYNLHAHVRIHLLCYGVLLLFYALYLLCRYYGPQIDDVSLFPLSFMFTQFASDVDLKPLRPFFFFRITFDLGFLRWKFAWNDPISTTSICNWWRFRLRRFFFFCWYDWRI